MNDYLINNDDWFHEGGSAQLYPILNYDSIGFKEFSSKKKAEYARKVQLKLSKFDLAPKVLSKTIKLKYAQSVEGWNPEISGWGFVTELAQHGTVSYRQIQNLVDKIWSKAALKFWDCHYSNIGYIKRKGKPKVVCIDTGKESFDGYANAWSNPDPGPKCCYCLKYECNCTDY
ncbi:hypothetical protein EB118_10320 [bacterium]|nr:hypothetical protein [bacterium]NDC71985.1 hypothetical protein [Sphingobacteriia bacterium]NDG30451.1 hypothetical protein [bacterium]